MSLNKIKGIQISFPDTKQLKKLSYGEITNTNTINYKTLKPILGGLFCARIFGSIKDYECLCGYCKGVQFINKTCPKCKIKITSIYARRRHIGHISLAIPVIHTWSIKILSSYLILFLPIKKEDLQTYLMSKETNLSKLFKEFTYSYGGPEILELLLSSIDLSSLYIQAKLKVLEGLSKKKVSTTSISYVRLLKIQKLVKSFLLAKARPEWIVLHVLPVIPPDLRPLVLLKNNFFITSDLNYLYRRIIHRNQRLKQLKFEKTSSSILHLEKKMLQESVDALFDNERVRSPILNSKKQPLKSLSHRLQGKEGRFRHNLLGKRVNYSGRSVIIVGPKLKLNQCGLPMYIVMELFKSFIQLKIKYWLLKNISFKEVKKIHNRKTILTYIIQYIDLIVSHHLILLNRAPTLHKLNIQAFEASITNIKAIQLHPLVCSSFNADFDGDQMAVHLPLTLEAQFEAKMLMTSSKNILSPASGNPIISPTQDIIFGLYFITMNPSKGKNSPIYVSSINKLMYLLKNDIIGIHHPIIIKLEEYSSDKKCIITKKVHSTAGRVLLYQIIPEIKSKNFGLVDKLFTKKDTYALINHLFLNANDYLFQNFLNKLTAFGFYYAFKAGLSIGKNDFIVPSFKRKVISFYEKEVQYYESLDNNNMMSNEDKYRNLVKTWNSCLDYISSVTISDVMSTNTLDKSSLYISIHSGARGSQVQLKQLSHLRGLMMKASGEIVNNPIKSNFLEGLTVLEYFDSVHGSRKGVIDTSLKTANAGYLTRKLIYGTHYSIVHGSDCGTNNGILIKSIISQSNTLLNVFNRVKGRVLAKEILNPETGSILFHKNHLLDNRSIEKLIDCKIESISIRSPITCKQPIGTCQKCYGLHLSTNEYPPIGLPIGVLAAQSIGEPGTQLTMRTFHQGGILQGSYEETLIRAPKNGRILINNQCFISNKKHNQESYLISRSNTTCYVINESYEVIAKYNLAYGTSIFLKDGDYVTQGDLIASWDPDLIPIISTVEGEIVEKSNNFNTIALSLTSMSKTFMKYLPEENYSINNAFFKINKSLKYKKKVSIGDILGYTQEEVDISKDITGDLSQVSRIFENSNRTSIIANESGYLYLSSVSKNKKEVSLSLYPVDGKRKTNFSKIAKSDIITRPYTFISKGEKITNGTSSLEEYLATYKLSKFSLYFIDSLQTIYLNQGVMINNKHFEVVLSQMLRRVKVTSSNTNYLLGEEVDVSDYNKINLRSIAYGDYSASKNILLKGLSQATLLGPSFISSASFQRTSRILAESALFNRTDNIIGLQENVILGRIIPAGTGYFIYNK